MIRRTSRRQPSRSALAGPAAAVALAALLAACGGTAATPASVPATPAPATPAPVTPEPTPKPTPEPTPEPYERASDAYDSRVTLPGASLVRQALRAWDGEARIDSDGPFVDRVSLPGSILFFVYGAPTDLDLAAYAAKSQAQVAEWHDCPTRPASVTDLPLDGTAGKLHQMTCLGVFVQKLMVVRDGQGLTVNMLAPPNVVDDASQLFEDLVATMTWPA